MCRKMWFFCAMHCITSVLPVNCPGRARKPHSRLVKRCSGALNGSACNESERGLGAGWSPVGGRGMISGRNPTEQFRWAQQNDLLIIQEDYSREEGRRIGGGPQEIEMSQFCEDERWTSSRTGAGVSALILLLDFFYCDDNSCITVTM